MKQEIYKFAGFEIDSAKRTLLKEGEIVSLNPKAFDLLVVLVEKREQILSKDDLINLVWNGDFIEENNITVQVSAIRKVLGDDAKSARFLKTIPGKGYKFVAAVEQFNGEEIVFEKHSFSKIVVEEEFSGDGEKTNPQVLDQTTAVKFSTISPLSVLSALAVLLICGVLIFQFWGSKKDSPKYRLIKAEKLTTSGKITNLALTPNGEYAVYSQKEGSGESLWLKHLKTGGQQQILKPQESKFVGLTVSPDGDFIYFSRFGNEAETFLERVSILGGVPEKVSDIDSAVSVSFSPDGHQVAYTESHTSAGKTSLSVSNLDGSNKKTLISAENNKRIIATYEANPVAWSPKGDAIAGAFEEKSEKGSSEMAIMLVDPEDGSEKSISEKRWHHAMELTWIDDDNLAFYGYERKGDKGNIWIVSRSTGNSYQLTNDSNFYQSLAGKNGKLIAIRGNEVARIKVAGFQNEFDKLEIKELHNESGHIGSVAWSDSDSVLFTSNAGITKEIWKLETEGGNPPTQLTVNSNISRTLSVSPADGRIVFSAEKNGFSELWLADRDGKKLTQLTFENKDSYPGFMPDGKSVIFQRGGAFSKQTLWRIGTDGNNLKQISKNYTAFPQVSPDGKKTAYYFMDESDQHWKIGIIDNQSGEKLGEIEFPKIINHRRMRWHPDNKVLAQVFYEGEDANLLILPVNKEKYKIIPGLGKGEIISMDWSADGRKLLFSQVNEIRDIVSFSLAQE